MSTGTLSDERGSQSAARTFLMYALSYQGVYLAVVLLIEAVRGSAVETLGVVLAFFTALDVGLIAWAGGARIAAYIGPQIGAAVQGVADSARALAERIRARRGADGTEPAGKVPQVFGD